METTNHEEQQILENEVITVNEKEKESPFTKFFSILFTIGVLYLGFLWLQNYMNEKDFLSTMYSYAVEEIKEHFTGANLKVSSYKKEYVVLQTREYKDFGYGELRYAKYAVKVPVEYDSTFGHMEQDITIIVYYYTSNQNISDGIDISVEDHFFVMDMFSDLYNLFQ